MRKLQLFMAVVLCSPIFVFAGVDDFNKIIEENAQAEKELSAQLSTELKTKGLGKIENPNFAKTGEAVLGRGNSENVAVDTAQEAGKRLRAEKQMNFERQNFRRLSEELRQAN